MASGRVSAKASEAISPSPTFDCWNKRIWMTRAEETRVYPSTPLASLLQHYGCPTLKRKRFIQAHGIQTSETNCAALRTLPVPRRFVWSHIMSYKNSQGQTDIGSCSWLQLPTRLQPLKNKLKYNIPLVGVEGSILLPAIYQSRQIITAIHKCLRLTCLILAMSATFNFFLP